MVEYPQTCLVFRFGRNSCYIFSLARAVEILLGVDLHAYDVLRVALSSVNVSSNAFVYDAGGLCHEMAELVPGIGKKKFHVHKEMQESLLPNAVNIQHWLYSGNGYTAHHFNLNGWDSLADKSQAERLGSVIDYRVVTLGD